MRPEGAIIWHGKGLRDRYRPENRVSRSLVSVAPWLNVALLIGLFLFLTFPYVLQPGVLISLPESRFESGTQYGYRVAILSQESPNAGVRDEIVFFEDERFFVRNSEEMDSLRAALIRAAHQKPKGVLIIEADRRVLHGTVVDVFNMAADAGIREINVATRPFRPASKP